MNYEFNLYIDRLHAVFHMRISHVSSSFELKKFIIRLIQVIHGHI